MPRPCHRAPTTHATSAESPPAVPASAARIVEYHGHLDGVRHPQRFEHEPPRGDRLGLDGQFRTFDMRTLVQKRQLWESPS
jgi:hypothetical protein